MVFGRKISFIIIAIICLQVHSQTNSIEFQDTIADQKTGAIGYKGTASSGYIFIETPNSPDVKIHNGNIVSEGTVSAAKYYKGNVEFDSVKAASLSDSTKTIPDGIVTGKKLSSELKIKDEFIDSISWSKIKGKPAGFADGIDDVGGVAADSVRAAAIADSCKWIPKNIKIDSARFANVADSSKKIPDSSVVSAKIARSAVKDIHIDSISWNKIKNKPVLNSLSGSLSGSKVDPYFSGRAFFNSDTLTKKTPGYANRIDLYNSGINLIGYPVIAGAPVPGGNDYGMMFGKPEGYTGTNADHTTFKFRAAIHNSGTSTLVLSDNLTIESTFDDSNSTIVTNTGSVNIAPKNGVLKVNGISVFSSDSVLKKNKEIIPDALERLDSINGYYFEFKKDEYCERNLPSGKQIGVLAQEIEKVYPELIYVDKEGFKSVAYDRLSVILIEALKHQKILIEEQHNQIEVLQNQIEKINLILQVR